ncbi:nucleotidyltransferase family protein [Bordetella genomosp. 12]|uniref:Nitrate reductase n=1 Tax=Bordetella genomosp. 12 TaxID=463035 RepID=A0A261VLM7_9BORD|nr:nucleotidyltransferase family protein [Bordetella genomosp. 12]OZI75026.1 hypothetical protein CAL22_11470 [Bordetella genomosp. 12]
MRHRLSELLYADTRRMAVLRQVRALCLPDAWIGAGFVRNAVWDAMAGRAPALPDDIDVIWFDARRAAALRDRVLEQRLARVAPALMWSVKNQSRMHSRNQDLPYTSCRHAIGHWPETATAVAVRLDADDRLALLAPLGLDDLFASILRPTPGLANARRDVFLRRLQQKRWLERWPFLRLAD